MTYVVLLLSHIEVSKSRRKQAKVLPDRRNSTHGLSIYTSSYLFRT